MNRTPAFAVFAFLCAASAHAQNPGAPQTPAIPIRQVTPPVSSDSGVISSIYGLRGLPGNRVVVNDYFGKRVVIFDETLKRPTIVMDTAAGAPANYGSFSTGLIPWMGDSTLIADRSSTAFIAIAANGKLGGIVSPPKASDLPYMSSALLDPKGRLVFRGYRRPPPSASVSSQLLNAPIGVPQITGASPDSSPILRGDFDARTVDTVGMFYVYPTKSVTVRYDPATSGGMISRGTGVFNPLQLTDEWTLLPDGTIAIVRGQDYHVDWISMDGKMTSTPKMPFEWKRITLEDKQRIVDSVKTAHDKYADSVAKNTPPPPPGAGGRAGAGTPPPIPFVVVEPAELPDYFPPVRAGQVKADYDGNVWILPSTSTLAKGGLLFDVVNRKGEIVERVQLPPNRNLQGFGPGGAVYISPPTSGLNSNTRLERVQVIRPTAPVKQ